MPHSFIFFFFNDTATTEIYTLSLHDALPIYYFSREYGLPCIDYIEPKPGIPPTPGHVLEVINEMREHHLQVLLSTNYYDHNQVLEVAQRTGAKAVIVPSNTNGAPGINTYFDLMNLWLTELARAFGSGGPAAN